MIIVVADTSPLNYLIQIECDYLLPKLFGQVMVPRAVVMELSDEGAPGTVKAWSRQLPQWLILRDVHEPADPALEALDPGEREAIQLALSERADLVLIDEKRGARVASSKGLAVTGTLGILIQAARAGLVKIDAALERLRTTGFRCTPQLLDEAKRRVAID